MFANVLCVSEIRGGMGMLFSRVVSLVGTVCMGYVMGSLVDNLYSKIASFIGLQQYAAEWPNSFPCNEQPPYSIIR